MANQRQVHFVRWVLSPDTSPAAVIPVEMGRCGVYVLEFGDGEQYVGQTVSLLARLAAHRRRWPDIVAIRFTCVAPEDLDSVERDVIAKLVQSGVGLRNTDLVTLPLRSEALDAVIDPQVQATWLDAPGTVEIGARGAIALQRARTAARHSQMTMHHCYAEIVASLGFYVSRCIPFPHLTEGRFWTVTSLPGTGRRADWRRLTTLSINNVEVLVFGELRAEGGPWEAAGFVNVAMDQSIVRRHPKAEPGNYAKVGEVTRIFFADPRDLTELFLDPVVEKAATKLSVGLLRKGAGLFGRFHSYQLADDVFGWIQRQSRNDVGESFESSTNVADTDLWS